MLLKCKPCQYTISGKYRLVTNFTLQIFLKLQYTMDRPLEVLYLFRSFYTLVSGLTLFVIMLLDRYILLFTKFSVVAHIMMNKSKTRSKYSRILLMKISDSDFRTVTISVLKSKIHAQKINTNDRRQ